jgi:hypothetical protein
VREPNAFLSAVTIALAAAWVVAAAAVLLRRWPARPNAAAPTQDLRPEPPAVAALLTRRCRVRPDAVPATLIDLAARRVLAIEQVQPNRFIIRRLAHRSATAPFEQQVCDLVESREVGGVVPAGALTTGPEASAGRWRRRFVRDVVADAQTRGLCRPLWDRATKLAFLVGLVPVGLMFELAIGGRDLDQVDWTTAGRAAEIAVFAAITGFGWILMSTRQRYTDTGRESASHWLGVCEHLSQGGFADLPPDAVIVWDRYLAYAAALGTATAAVRAIPMGAEDERRAWSTYGGTWHQVKVRYPRSRPGWGRHPTLAIVHAVVGLAAGGGLLWLWRRAEAMATTDFFVDTAVTVIRIVARVGAGIGAVLIVWCAIELVLAIPDLWLRREVIGEVVRCRERWAHPFWVRHGRAERVRWFVAIDPGGTDRVVAMSVPSKHWARFSQGDIVRVEVTSSLRHLRRMGRRRDAPGYVGQPSTDHEDLEELA